MYAIRFTFFFNLGAISQRAMCELLSREIDKEDKKLTRSVFDHLLGGRCCDDDDHEHEDEYVVI
jgi:hypothetical protein